MEVVTAYKCSYCHRCFGRKVNAIQHENSCKNNPKSRNCCTCVHGITSIVSWVRGIFEDHETTPVYGAYCDEFDMPIFDKPYLEDCDRTNNYYEPPTHIPFTCTRYEYKGYAGYPRGKEDDSQDNTNGK